MNGKSENTFLDVKVLLMSSDNKDHRDEFFGRNALHTQAMRTAARAALGWCSACTSKVQRSGRGRVCLGRLKGGGGRAGVGGVGMGRGEGPSSRETWRGN